MKKIKKRKNAKQRNKIYSDESEWTQWIYYQLKSLLF
jgi:hypothetical protein